MFVIGNIRWPRHDFRPRQSIHLFAVQLLGLDILCFRWQRWQRWPAVTATMTTVTNALLDWSRLQVSGKTRMWKTLQLWQPWRSSDATPWFVIPTGTLQSLSHCHCCLTDSQLIAWLIADFLKFGVSGSAWQILRFFHVPFSNSASYGQCRQGHGRRTHKHIYKCMHTQNTEAHMHRCW